MFSLRREGYRAANRSTSAPAGVRLPSGSRQAIADGRGQSPLVVGAGRTVAARFQRVGGVAHDARGAGEVEHLDVVQVSPIAATWAGVNPRRSTHRAVPVYPCDAVSAERLVALAAAQPGPAHIRTSRPKTPVIYSNDESFVVGGLKGLRESPGDVATVIGAGVTVFEALKAYEQLKADGTLIRVIDLYSLSPIDKAGLVAAGRATGGHLTTVEDHYPAGGVADAVAVADAGFAVHRLAVRAMPRSGKPEELLERYGISASHIVTAVHSVNAGVSRRSPVTSR